jgi:hypothetical protein
MAGAISRRFLIPLLGTAAVMTLVDYYLFGSRTAAGPAVLHWTTFAVAVWALGLILDRATDDVRRSAEPPH